MALGVNVDDSVAAASNPNLKQSITPSAPPMEESNEPIDENQVRFVVVIDSSTPSQPIAAQTDAINASESLRRIINEKTNCDSRGNHIIKDITEPEFRQLIEFLEKKKLTFIDQNHRLQMFNVAKLYNCADMQIYCLREVDANLDESNVITVYRSLWFYRSLTSNKKDVIDRKTKANSKKVNYTPEEFLTNLVFNVQQFINMHAENVLLSEEIDNLTFKEFENIVKQDDLLLRSEMVLINALARWSREECRRRNIELTFENERMVLGELCYAPRYLTLKPSEFELACKNIRFLDPAEITLIREAFDGKKSNLSTEQTNMLNNFRKPRPKYTRMPIYLSARSHPKKYPRRMLLNDRDEDSETSSCFLNCLAAFVCLCD